MSVPYPVINLPETKLIKTLKEIAVYCRIGERSVPRWIKKHNFPAAKLPDGTWATTVELIGLWLLARRKAMAAREAQNASISPPNP